MNNSKTEFLTVRSKQQLERVLILLFVWVRVRSHLWCQCETWVWFLTPTYKWVYKSQKPANTLTIILKTLGESENPWARKPRARLYMHLSPDWLLQKLHFNGFQSNTGLDCWKSSMNSWQGTQLHPINGHLIIKWSLCPEGSKIQERYFRQTYICNVRTSHMELLVEEN